MSKIADRLAREMERAYEIRQGDKEAAKEVGKRLRGPDLISKNLKIVVDEVCRSRDPRAVCSYPDNAKLFSEKCKAALEFLHKERMRIVTLIRDSDEEKVELFFNFINEYRASVRSVELSPAQPVGKSKVRACRITSEKARSNSMYEVTMEIALEGVVRTQKFHVRTVWGDRLFHWCRVASMYTFIYWVACRPTEKERAEHLEILATGLKNSVLFLTQNLTKNKTGLSPCWFE